MDLNQHSVQGSLTALLCYEMNNSSVSTLFCYDTPHSLISTPSSVLIVLTYRKQQYWVCPSLTI